MSLRGLFAALFLLAGLMTGSPITPEQIEEQMRSMSTAKMVQVLEDGQQGPTDLPDNIGEILDRWGE